MAEDEAVDYRKDERLERRERFLLTIREHVPDFDRFSQPMQQAIEEIVAYSIGDRPSPLLLTGESGVGKSYFMELAHRCSKRSTQSFKHLNCAAISETLVEAELFGTEKGAYTGAIRRSGFLEVANQGTLGLDEVGHASKEFQMKLLRVLDNGSFFRVGGTQELHTDMRIVAATSRNIHELLEGSGEGEDVSAPFFNRIGLVDVHIPSLRERPEDVFYYLEKTLEKFSIEHADQQEYIEQVVHQLLKNRFSWPANVRSVLGVVQKSLGAWTRAKDEPGQVAANIYDSVQQGSREG